MGVTHLSNVSHWKGVSRGETRVDPLAALPTTDYRETRVEAERPVRDSDNNPRKKQAVGQVNTSSGQIETMFWRQIPQGSPMDQMWGVGQREETKMIPSHGV